MSRGFLRSVGLAPFLSSNFPEQPGRFGLKNWGGSLVFYLFSILLAECIKPQEFNPNIIQTSVLHSFSRAIQDRNAKEGMRTIFSLLSEERRAPWYLSGLWKHLHGAVEVWGGAGQRNVSWMETVRGNSWMLHSSVSRAQGNSPVAGSLP